MWFSNKNKSFFLGLGNWEPSQNGLITERRSIHEVMDEKVVGEILGKGT